MRHCILALILLQAFSTVAQTSMLHSYGFYEARYSATNFIDNGITFQVLKVTKLTKTNYQRMKFDNYLELLNKNGISELFEFSILEYEKTTGNRSSFQDYIVLPTSEVKKSDLITTHNLKELAALYPNLIKLEKEDIHTYENKRVITYSFNPYYQQYFQAGSQLFTCNHPSRTDKAANQGLYNNSYDVKSNEALTIYYGDKNKEDKWASFKNIEAISTDLNCNIINHYSMSFEYPNTYDRYLNVTNINNPSESLGKLLLFTRLNAGKNADPDKANIQLAFCANDGKTMTATVKFRDDNKGWQKIHGAFSDGNKLYISYHSFGSQGSVFGIKEIDSLGQIKDYTYTEENLQAHTNIANGNYGQLNRSRKALGQLADKPAFNWGVQDFDMQGAQKLGDKIYLWGQAIYNSADTNFKGEGVAPTIKNFAEGFIFVYNQNFEFENMYILNLPSNKLAKEFNIISTEKNTLEFFIPIESTDKKDYEKTIITNDKDSNKRLPNNYDRLISPLFVSVNSDGCKFQYYPEIYTLNLKQGLVNSSDGNKYIVGFEAEAGIFREDTGEDVYGNKHYMKIQTVNY